MLKPAMLIAANGPSLTQIDFRRVPANAKILRLNNFFFEDKYYATKKVDFYFTHQGFLHGQYFNIHHLKQRGEYDIGQFYTADMPIYCPNYPLAIEATPIVDRNPHFRHIRIFHQLYYNHMLSGGIFAIFLAYMLGYRRIYLAGLDLYDESMTTYPWSHETPIYNARHPRDKPETLLKIIQAYHPRDLQLQAIAMLKQCEDLELFSVAENSPMTLHVGLAPICNTKPYVVEDKPESYSHDWFELPLRKNDTDIVAEAMAPPPPPPPPPPPAPEPVPEPEPEPVKEELAPAAELACAPLPARQRYTLKRLIRGTLRRIVRLLEDHPPSA